MKIHKTVCHNFKRIQYSVIWSRAQKSLSVAYVIKAEHRVTALININSDRLSFILWWLVEIYFVYSVMKQKKLEKNT